MNYKSFLLALALCPAVMRATDVKSPDGRLVVSVDLQNGTPVYKVNYDKREVVKKSKLGFELYENFQDRKVIDFQNNFEKPVAVVGVTSFPNINVGISSLMMAGLK